MIALVNLDKNLITFHVFKYSERMEYNRMDKHVCVCVCVCMKINKSISHCTVAGW